MGIMNNNKTGSSHNVYKRIHSCTSFQSNYVSSRDGRPYFVFVSALFTLFLEFIALSLSDDVIDEDDGEDTRTK